MVRMDWQPASDGLAQILQLLKVGWTETAETAVSGAVLTTILLIPLRQKRHKRHTIMMFVGF